MTLHLIAEFLMLLAIMLAGYLGVTRFRLRKHFQTIKQSDSSISAAMKADIERQIYTSIHGVTPLDIFLLMVTALLAFTSKVLAIYSYLSVTPET